VPKVEKYFEMIEFGTIKLEKSLLSLKESCGTFVQQTLGVDFQFLLL